MRNLQDKDNLCPDYKFILENLDFLVTEVKLRTIENKYPDRKNFSYMQNLKLLTLKQDIIQDVQNKIHSLIYYNAYQWESIVKTIEKENAY
jgi:hypothetical protein